MTMFPPPPRILIVDDKPYERKVLRRGLEASGFSVLEADTSERCLAAAVDERPALILLDVFLNDTDPPAEETLQKFRARKETRDIPVFAVSRLVEDPAMEASLLKAGAALFLNKAELFTAKEGEPLSRHIRAQLVLSEKSAARSYATHEALSVRKDEHLTGNILLIEDDPQMSDYLRLALESRGNQVETAPTGKIGLKKLFENPPDLLILDLCLPDMDGLEVCSRAKKDLGLRKVPILILTARASEETHMLAIERSADHYMAKPIPDIEEFHLWISSLLRRGRHLRKLYSTTRADENGAAHLTRIKHGFITDPRGRRVPIQEHFFEDLSPTLYELLLALAERPDEVLSREYLVHRVWDDSVRDAEVDVAVHRLKRCLGPGAENLIECVRGQGFRLNSPA
ncbi:MAG: response regulator [Elusimicrobiota bacterium]|jgi:DNA-binding response OmpR family regulator